MTSHPDLRCDSDDPEARRFWAHVDVRSPAECWNWLRGCFSNGYGAFVLRNPKRTRHSSRVAYMFTHGKLDLPSSVVVMHTCDNRLCCNPEHLRSGSNDENMADMAAKGRASQGDEHWTRRDPANLLRGEQVKGSKLKAEDIPEIWRMRAAGLDMPTIAKRFGVTKQKIWQVLHGRAWSHISKE